MEICQNPDILNTTLIIIRILKIVFIIAPIILMILACSDFFLNVISVDDVDLKKSSLTVLRRIIACIALFLVPTIFSYFNSVLIDLNIASNYTDCITNANSEYIEKRRIEIADEYLATAKEKNDMESYLEAKKAIVNISDKTEKEKRLNEVDAMIDNIKEIEKQKQEEKEKEYENSYNTGNRLKFYNSLSVLHSGQSKDNTIDLFESAGQAKFYAAECDLRLSGNTLYCAHGAAPSTATKFADYIKLCKKYGMKALLDLKWPSSPNWTNYNFYTMVSTLADNIKNNNLQNVVIVQTSNKLAMQKINDKVSNVKYWYLVADYDGTNAYNTLVSNMKTYKDAGVIAVNITANLATDQRMQTIKNNDLELCVYSVNTDSARKRYSDFGAEYIMTDNIS